MDVSGHSSGLIAGHVAPGFSEVADAFAEVVAGQRGTGAALAIQRGELLIDIWGGWSDAQRSRRWLPDSLVQPYSVSKPFVAVSALLLVDRGVLSLDVPIQRYWPELRAETSLRQLLSHQAGLVALDEPSSTEVFYDWDRLCALLADQQPSFPPGTRHGESALFYGHLVGEVVRRVDGRRPGQFLAEEVSGPLGLDFHFGLSAADQTRAVELTGFAAYEAAQRADTSKPPLYWQAVGNPPGTRDPAVVNSPAWRAAEVPAINGHGTARAIAGFYAALAHGGLLSDALLAEATAVQTAGTDAVFGQDNSWGLGFGVDEYGFGMGGLGGSWGGYAPDGDYSLAFVTGTMGNHDRITGLENTFRSLIGLSPIE